jgi:hypothetical protein
MAEITSIKSEIISMLNRLPDDIDYERAIEGIALLQRIEMGIAESEGAEGTEHEEFMRELLEGD